MLRKYINVVYKFVYCYFYEVVLEDSVLIIFIFLIKCLNNVNIDEYYIYIGS